MSLLRRILALPLAAGVSVATLASPASAQPGEPAASYDGPHVVSGPGGVVCDTDVPESNALPDLDRCAPMPWPSNLTYGCEMVGAITTSGTEVGTVSGSATSTDVRVYYTEVTCTVIQDATDAVAAQATQGVYARAANVSFDYVLPASAYHVCASGLVRYVENNVVKVASFGDPEC